ncbi:hypothetical protein KKG41_05045 [Patescibacteria group bacterium]|nr:hypothetical protein [Patescibacteria group bacterium]
MCWKLVSDGKGGQKRECIPHVSAHILFACEGDTEPRHLGVCVNVVDKKGTVCGAVTDSGYDGRHLKEVVAEMRAATLEGTGRKPRTRKNPHRLVFLGGLRQHKVVLRQVGVRCFGDNPNPDYGKKKEEKVVLVGQAAAMAIA